VGDYLVRATSNPAYEQYNKMVLAYEPDFVVSMFGHNGSASPAEYYADYLNLTKNFVENTHGLAGYLGAVPILVGPHPKVSSDGKPILGQYEDQLGKLAAEQGYGVAKIWHRLLPLWTRPDSTALLDGVDAIHIGSPGHILIAHAVAQELGWSAEVSSATINAGQLTLVASKDAVVTGIKSDGLGGIEFQRLDKALPWAIDEGGRANATTLVPESCAWQEYLLTVSGLAAGQYTVSIDDEDVAVVSAAGLAAGWNMAGLSTGPIWRQCQEVLGRIRDMHGISRESFGRLGPPWKAVEYYKSHVRGKYETDGLRGQDLVNAELGNLGKISLLDGLIHEAAQPVIRRFSIRLTSAGAPNPEISSKPNGLRVVPRASE